MRALFQFYLKNYLKSNKFIVPIIAFFSYQAMAYSIIPVDVLPSYTLSALVLFLIMVWFSFSFNEAEAVITEQIIFLKIKNKALISLSKILVMLFFGSAFALAGTVYPLVVNALNHFHVFTRAIQGDDIIFSFLIHLLFSLVGSMMGLIFHGRIIKNRKQAIILVILLALSTVVKGAIEHDVPITRLVTWVIPPLYGFSQACTKTEYLSIDTFILPLIGIIAYLLVEIVVYIKLTRYRLF